MTEMQRQFEEWAQKSGFNLKIVFPLLGDASADNAVYANGQTRSAWQAWQASRAAIVVKLPNLFDGSPDNATYYDYMYRKSEMEKALDDAGVSYE